MAISLDSSLVHVPYIESAKVEPLNTFYQSLTSQSNTVAGTSWFVQNPASGALLDNEAYIEYDLMLTITGRTNFHVGQYMSGAVNGNLMLRHGCCMARAMQNVQLNINGTVLTARPDRYADEYVRMYATKMESDNIFTMSGGELDTGMCDAVTPSNIAYDQVFPLRDNVVPNDTGTVWGAVPRFGLQSTFTGGPNPSEFVGSTVSATTTDQVFLFDQVPQELTNCGAFKRELRMLNRHYEDQQTVNPSAASTGNLGGGQLWPRMHDHVLQTDGTNNDIPQQLSPQYAGYKNEIRLRVWERVPISPFLWLELKDGKRSIPNIKQMNLDINWNANASALIAQTFGLPFVHTDINTFANANDDGLANEAPFLSVYWYTGQYSLWTPTAYNAGGTTSVDFKCDNPKLHLKWYIPPAGFFTSIPPEITLRVQEPIVYLQNAFNLMPVENVLGNDLSSGLYPAYMNNIRLTQIPDFFIIYFKSSPNTQRQWFPSEYHMEIVNMEIKLDGDAGKLISCSQGELYAMYIRNSPGARERSYPFDEWQRAYCTAIIRPHDLGMRFGPGINHPITIDISANVRRRVNRSFINRHVSQIGRQKPSGTEAMPTGVQVIRGTNIPHVNNVYYSDHYGALGAVASSAFAGETNSISFEPVCIAVYDKVELMLSKDGGSARRLQQIPKAALSQDQAETFGNQAGSNVRLLDVLGGP